MTPINHCRSLGYDDENIVIDTVLSGNPHIEHSLASFYNAFGVAKRTFELMQYYERMFGVLRAKSGHPDVKFRYVIGPNREMSNKVVPVEVSRGEVEK
mmetsp:Transcript_15938/g.24642  ORF Transcript_15938/g.24642 Transcript_15938/m.24642 type:complete len:98 (+) Transcript_15938:749-1042(+)